MVRIFEVLTSDSDNDQPPPKIRICEPDSDCENTHPIFEPKNDYLNRVEDVAREMFGYGFAADFVQYGGGKREAPKPVDPTKRNGRILDTQLFSGRYHKCLSAAMVHSRYLKACRIAVRIEMNEGYKLPYPDDALLALAKQVVFETEKAAKERHLKPNHFIIHFESHVLDEPIFVHLRSTKESAFLELLAEFEKLDMSNRAKGRPSIINAPFIIDVNAIYAPRKAKAGKNIKHSGGGGCQRQKHLNKRLKIKYHAYDGAFWEQLPMLSNTLCLFHSIIIGAAYALKKAQRFFDFKTNIVAQNKEVMKLMRWCKINRKLRQYAIEDYGEKVQSYYDKFHPGKIKLFAFKSIANNFKPFWESGVQKFEKAVSIFYDYDEKHYMPLKNVGRLFGERFQYCFKCFSPFRNKDNHKTSCMCKCKNCMRVGPAFPCIEEEGFEHKCDQCNRLFLNRECFAHHLKKRNARGKDNEIIETSVCTRTKKCKECGVVYKAKLGHRCEDKWCPKCKGMHQKGRYCYMQYRPKSDKPQRFIAYDFETTPRLIPDTEFRFRHCVNMCVAYVWCTECQRKGIWDKPLDGWCKYCGDARTYAWCSFPIDDDQWQPDVVYQMDEDDDILPAFVNWLLYFDRDRLNIPEKKVRKGRKGENGGKRKKSKQCNPFVDEAAEDDEEEDEEEEEEEEEDDDEKEDEEDDEEYEEAGIVQKDLIEEMDEEEQTNASEGKRCPSIVYAHCGSRYDHVIVFSEILKKKGLHVSNPIRRGNKLMQFEVKKTGIVTHTVFRDSYNIISIPLDSFVKTFDLQIPGIPGKMIFPHGFNRPENYHLQLDHLPALEFYSPGTKNPKAKKELEQWHAANYHQPFCLKDVLARYCFFDVLILAHGIVKMHELYKETSGLDITRYLTMASACVAHFLSTLEKEVVQPDGKTKIERTKLAIVPEMGYERREKSSAIATNYLKWLAHKKGWDIEHAQTANGEVRVCGGQYAVDGYVRRPGHPRGDLVIEIYGCYWHGCPADFPDDDDIIGYGETAGSKRKADARREEEIRSDGHQLKIIWECEIREKLGMDLLEYEDELVQNGEENVAEKITELKEMKEFFANLVDNGPIETSDAFFGGRTGAEWMSSVADSQTSIKYLDVNSLYPSINLRTRYPIGHPTPKFWPEVDVDWCRPEDMRDPDNGNPLEGIIKGYVVPPRHPKWGVPVIPHRVGKRLLFPLCRTCAEKHPKGCVKLGYECPHETDEERGFVFTLTHPELGKALEAGYRVTKLFRAYVWGNAEDWSDDLFGEYIRCWMIHKYHASGWPKQCTDEKLTERQRERNKDRLLRRAFRKYGIVLDREKMIFNPGLRFLAKQALNSLWGRLALRNRLTKTIITDDITLIGRTLNNKSIRISMLDQISEQYWMLGYETNREATMEHPTSNPIIALWTTSLARCHLLDQMRGVYQDQKRMKENPADYPNGIFRADARILYYDTDSLIFAFRKALGCPLMEGEHLGELKDEYPSHTIKEFWALAPKAYCMMLETEMGEMEYSVKTRSITLDHNTAQQINAERIREMVMDMYNPEKEKDNFELVNVSNNFRAGRAGGITTIPMSKKFGPTLNKGILTEAYRLAPYGFKICEKCSQNGYDQCICMFTIRPKILK